MMFLLALIVIAFFSQKCTNSWCKEYEILLYNVTMTFDITILGIKGLFVTLSMNDIQHK